MHFADKVHTQKVKYFLLALERISCNNKIDDFSAAPNPLSWVKKHQHFLYLSKLDEIYLLKSTPHSPDRPVGMLCWICSTVPEINILPKIQKPLAHHVNR